MGLREKAGRDTCRGFSGPGGWCRPRKAVDVWRRCPRAPWEEPAARAHPPMAATWTHVNKCIPTRDTIREDARVFERG